MDNSATVLCISNWKGGVGKSTIATTMAISLSRKGYKVLCIDLDPSNSLTSALGGSLAQKQTKSIYDVLTAEAFDEASGQYVLDAALQSLGEVDLIGSGEMLAHAEQSLAGPNRLFELADVLSDNQRDGTGKSLREKYDFIVLDTPPEPGVLVYNAYMASDDIIIPTLCEELAVSRMVRTIQEIKEIQASPRFNPSLRIAGVIANRFDRNKKVQNYHLGRIRELEKQGVVPVFNATIRASVVVEDAQTLNKNIFDYGHRRKEGLIGDYAAFVSEYLRLNESKSEVR